MIFQGKQILLAPATQLVQKNLLDSDLLDWYRKGEAVLSMIKNGDIKVPVYKGALLRPWIEENPRISRMDDRCRVVKNRHKNPFRIVMG